MQEVLEAEMDEALGASKSERTPERLGYQSRYCGRRTRLAAHLLPFDNPKFQSLYSS